ncbi:MAG: aspartate ammonia-lyase [Defluviitaleaceae bacterium]|nr:aspartate ammonia-lyase [Defluviitaleaceae bacterium]
MATRTVKDSLGTKEVPASAYYGINTARALENFPITGYMVHDVAKELVVALAIVKKAAALANLETVASGTKAAEVLPYIIEACDEIIQDDKYHYQKHFRVDPIQGGAGTSLNMNANEVIANIALEKMGYEKGRHDIIDPNDHVNMSQSTNDVIPTAARIAIRLLLNDLLETMKLLNKSFINKSKEFDDIVKIGRTHLQDAVPIRLGQEFEAYSCVLRRDIDRIEQTGNYLYAVNMGATAVGTALNTNPEYVVSVIKHLKAITGKVAGKYFPIRSCENLIDGTQNTDCYTEVSAQLKICMMNMSKIANDLRLMASGPRCGLGEITLEKRQAGSSIMPDKVNPVLPELINQVAFQVIGNDHTICLASEAGQFELNVMQPVLVFNLIQSVSMMNNAFNVFSKFCVDTITVTDRNRARMDAYVDKSASLATALSPALGYKTSEMIARKSREEGVSVLDVCLADKEIVDKLGEAKLREILDPDKMTRGGEMLTK